MMNEPEKLLQRLDDIGRSLAERDDALALIGLGSVGLETDRLDEFSDLDFFVIVKDGCQRAYIQDLSWLSDVAPIAYRFLNSRDGYKLLFEDGIFCEFAIFELEQLIGIPFSAGRIVWKAAGVSDEIARPPLPPPQESRPVEWLVGEAVTNLYVGLGRELRGEKLSAMQFIQGYALDRLLDLVALGETAESGHEDIFDPRRRTEIRYPRLAKFLPDFLQGYERNCEAALAILNFLDNHYQVNKRMKEAIIELVDLGVCKI